MNKKTSVFANGLIWFGAGVSIAEILTGTYFAPLGIKRGLLAIILGHIIGGFFMFLIGLIGARTGKSAMETVKMSFGKKGGIFFAILNIIQLGGWTAIMIYDGALAADKVFSTGAWIWALIIGALIILWIFIGIENLGKVNLFAMTSLFILTIILCKIVFFDSINTSSEISTALSFGAAIELAAVMPLSWLPVISDYTREAKEPFKATLVSSLIYNLVSIWMYTIGMGAAIFTGEIDISIIMLKTGMGIIGLLIIVLSTVTTTFLDAFSTGISAESVSNRINGKSIAIITTIIGTILAIVFPMDDITDFLYVIGSVFAPMAAIMIVDYFILKKDHLNESINLKNFFIWLLGFLLYRYLLILDTSFGTTLIVIVLTMILSSAIGKIFEGNKSNNI
ncbi:MAG: putative hydroxymethylpyrimidine transporter CytX [Andreesenia angusta]|nr:putative hydroxymethylpyrimidine transporter CytX [Andreesenia angusta]